MEPKKTRTCVVERDERELAIVVYAPSQHFIEILPLIQELTIDKMVIDAQRVGRVLYSTNRLWFANMDHADCIEDTMNMLKGNE